MMQGICDVPPQQFVISWNISEEKAENIHVSGSKIENDDTALCSMDACCKDTSLWEVGCDAKILWYL